MGFSEEFGGMVKGNAKEDDLGFVEMQAGFMDGQGLIFL